MMKLQGNKTLTKRPKKIKNQKNKDQNEENNI
jgi:hypothetical protein